MTIKEVELSAQEINSIKSKLPIQVKTGTEKNVDYHVRRLLSDSYGDEYISQGKTGNSNIDEFIPSKSGSGKGDLDVFCYNLFGNNNLDFIVENKHPEDKSNNPSNEAILYANGINQNNKVGIKTRLIIGYNPANNNSIIVKVLVGDSWEDLIIDGTKVSNFFNKDLVKLVYNNPDINEFNLKTPGIFTQQDFHKIIEELRVSYRLNSELSSSDKAKIDFTIAFISLKMILEKENITSEDNRTYKWNQLKSLTDIKNSVEVIVDKFDKYKDIFILVKNKKGSKKSGEVIFNFVEKISQMENSAIMNIHSVISKIPNLHSLKLDLFGETYEVLASKKTKSELGEYFTRRHIIRPLIRLFYTQNDLQNIILNQYKLCDTSCGTGGFLTESFKYIEEYYNEHYQSLKLNLSELAQKTICGYDINGSNITRTKINMYLAGDGFSEIEVHDTLKLPTTKKEDCGKCKNCLENSKNINTKDFEKKNCSKPIYLPDNMCGKFNYIVTNVPYGKGEYCVDPSISNNKRLEVNFLIQIVKLLKSNGKALIIVPDGLIEAPTLASVREWFLKQCKINSIVSLPKFAFAPYTKEKTYVLYIEKRLKPLDTIEDVISLDEQYWSYIIDNDGFANSDKRFETNLKESNGKWKHNELSNWIDKNNMSHLSLIEEKFNKEQAPTEIFKDEWGNDIDGKKYGFIKLSKIFESKIIAFAQVKKDVDLNNIINSRSKYLTDEDIELLNTKRTVSKKGILGKVELSKLLEELYDADDKIIESSEFLQILDKLDLGVSTEEKALLDSQQKIVKYAINLIPEKYFRQKPINIITLSELERKKKDIENSLKNILSNLMGG